ncbi:MAG TPA: hypothetical protein VJZ77_15665 [Blastocatellia bacterium]|nr:hypothetical protein [Blastocatellia bacterium]
MNTPLSLARFFLSLLFIILLTPVLTMGQRLHPKLKEAKPGGDKLVINRVVVLPAQVSLTKDGMKGSEPLEKEAAAATPIIENAVAKALTAKKLTVLDSHFTPEALQNDEKLKYAAADLRRNYDELLAKVTKKQKDVEKGRFSLGDQVLLLNQDDNIDAFIFVNAAGQRKSGGKKALGWMMLDPSMILPTYFIKIGIIDARTGDALAYTQVRTTYDIGKEDDKKLVDILAGTLKKLPSGTPAEKK